MANLRKEARGRDCQIRIPNVCNGDPATTVLCHLPGGGMGTKHHDIHAALGCSACHDVVDSRVRTDFAPALITLYFMDAVIRTQEIWINEGFISV